MAVEMFALPNLHERMIKKVLDSRKSLFVCLFEALCPGQQFFSHFGTASWV